MHVHGQCELALRWGQQVAGVNTRLFQFQFQLCVHRFRRFRRGEGAEWFVRERCAQVERNPPPFSGVAGFGYGAVPREMDGGALGSPPHLLYTQHVDLVGQKEACHVGDVVAAFFSSLHP